MALNIGRLSFEHHRSALGIAETEPRISWRFNGTVQDWTQSSYDLEIMRGSSEPKSFAVDSSDSVYVPWPDGPLGEAEGAEVRVRARGADSETPWSDWVHVETGLTDKWEDVSPITTLCKQPTDGPKRPMYFRKDFDVPSNLKSARLYITALGLYEAEINGRRVGDHVLAPGWQSYNHRHVYDTYDVTEMLVAGEKSVLGAVVGEGWFSGRLGWGGGNRNIYGDTLGLLAVLILTAEDGTTIEIPTDASWKSLTEGPIISGEIYNGEHFDDRIAVEIEGWATRSFNASGWSGTRSLDKLRGRLASPDQPPIRATEEIRPQRIFKSPSGKTLVDFGQNLVGWLRIRATGPSGHRIQLRHAEVLEDGELARRPLRQAWQEEQVWLSGREITYEPKFTYHGFRFAQVDDWPAETPLDADHLIAVVVHTDMEQTGWFESSNELINKFHSNVRWSMKGNFMSIPTDCPQRDERAGWTGDAHMFGPTANYLYDTAGFWRGWHRDVWSEMSSNGKMIPYAYTPTIPSGFGDQMPTAIWGDVVVGSPWNTWQAFGDSVLLREHLPQAQNWIDKGVARNSDGLWDRTKFQFGDWLDPESPFNDPAQSMTSPYLVADAYLVQMTGLLADIVEALGEAGDVVDKYRAQRSDLQQMFQQDWMSDGRLANATQTAYALALEFDLFSNVKDLTNGTDTLRQLIADNDYLVGTGFAGTAPLGGALTKANATEDFYRMLLQEKSPSWLYQVVMGGTTTWERWDSLLPDGSLNPGEMLSFNHYAFGSVADWIHRNTGGIAPAEPGYKRIRVAPVPGGGITKAKATLVSPFGRISTDWSVDEHGFHLTLEVPPNSRAIVVMPSTGQSIEVGSGSHEFSDAGFRMPGSG
ncbi:hypothetical protein D7B24_008898 [Verticillium nonalfalfae]|uniref:alpha-L-rhamnosidase n=1 Tax=Verticillium nonalfalfae TaxID=1051616 RepID=A0A3M9Y4K5_9PEZI|nr:uncharacterized protein D7B24_008898 [Verticillium nonalfalfae]RNJ55201.1 hypothetical protein D7B24_008898 [Verticillium nonalfalfae]